MESLNEGDTNEAEQQAHRHADASLNQKHGVSSALKNAQPRNVAEIESLQAQLAALTLRLKQLKQTRSVGFDALLAYGSYWRTEAKYQSKQRAVAQLENERLRALLQDQKQIALRFVNVMKRKPISRTIQTLDRYEQAAGKRAMKIDPEFNQAFACIDAELALAYLFARRPNLFIVRPQQSERPKICIEVRRSLCLSYDLAAASDAIWRFRPHEEHRKHFIYEHIDTSLGSAVGYTSRFQPKQSFPTRTIFRAKFLHQWKYLADDRVAIAWKIRVQTTEPDLSQHLYIWGRGHHVISSENRNEAKRTILRSSSWFSPDSATVALDQAQRDPRFQIMMDFLRHNFESFSAFTKELGAQRI